MIFHLIFTLHFWDRNYSQFINKETRWCCTLPIITKLVDDRFVINPQICGNVLFSLSVFLKALRSPLPLLLLAWRDEIKSLLTLYHDSLILWQKYSTCEKSYPVIIELLTDFQFSTKIQWGFWIGFSIYSLWILLLSWVISVSVQLPHSKFL